jgi:small subunit ribosomal protein S20
MANTRKSGKRAKQALKKNARNQVVKSSTRTAIKTAMEALKSLDEKKAKDAYKAAVKALSKAASKGAIPKARAARKISRMTKFAQKTLASVTK